MYTNKTMWFISLAYPFCILAVTLWSGNGVISGITTMNDEWWVINNHLESLENLENLGVGQILEILKILRNLI